MTGTGLYLSTDIHAVLRALALIVAAMPAGDFRTGYQAALAAVAVAFGLEEQEDHHALIRQ